MRKSGGCIMKTVLFLLLSVGMLYASIESIVENALSKDRSYEVAGIFGTHDFARASNAFDWAFTTNDGTSYQLQGREASINDVFGWKEVSIATPTPKWYMFKLKGDVDGDGSEKFDWVLASTDLHNRAMYKLAGVDNDGNFKYSSKLKRDYSINGTTLTIKSNTQTEIQCTQIVDDICIVSSLGNASDDTAVATIYYDVASFFEFNTIFNFFNEGSAQNMNAFATDTNYLFFGTYMFEAIKKASPQNYATMVSGIMAHEYGHIVQFNTYVDTSKLAPKRQTVNVGSTIVLSELEADAFSGLYMYFKLNSQAQIEAYFNMLEELGDSAFTDPNHHGTSEQRQAAAAYGILAADYIITNNLQDYIEWVDIRGEFIKGIAQYILYDVDYRAVPNQQSSIEITHDQVELIKDIAHGKKSITDLKLHR
jgi:hypothetical protein